MFAVIEAFKGYDNLLALFAGNEVVNDEQSAAVSPRYVKAVVRDMKNYIAAHVYRSIPIGYSAADDLKVALVQLSLLIVVPCWIARVFDLWWYLCWLLWCQYISMYTSLWSLLIIRVRGPNFHVEWIQYIDSRLYKLLSTHHFRILPPKQLSNV